MTYQEKKSIVSIVAAILITGLYSAFKYAHYPAEELDAEALYHYWGAFVLVLLLVSILAHIVISIVFNIVFRVTTREKEPGFADELDKLIELKSNRNGFFVFILGFLLAMVSLVLNKPISNMFIILITAGFLSDITGSATKLYHYRKGV
ncbi:hypothetical protein [Paenibacillus albus]|uniref:DUF2178 domain-containing protein n=1 Tax=Paenibacillus albus TaxID=2495582 RepID=A0A3Q8X1M6_9BACL|nr:hypothetical protein [Paenibacillus albus]AZN38341.1 hypothetical protein EJC50_00600 [Paenibacillus albus]